jgi:hypothetical protein
MARALYSEIPLMFCATVARGTLAGLSLQCRCRVYARIRVYSLPHKQCPALWWSKRLEDVIDSDPPAQEILGIARSFIAARRAARPIAEYPGPVPPDMATGYATQEAAIGIWPDRIAGWKVGLVAPSLQARLGTAHLAGPIFLEGLVRSAGVDAVSLAAIPGGFAAIEVELIVVPAAAPGGELRLDHV